MRRYSLALLLVTLFAARATVITNWNGGSGLWSASTNWDNGVPSTPGFTAVINSSGSDQITLDSSLPSATVDSLQLSQGTVNVDGSSLTLAPPDATVNPLVMGSSTIINVIDASPVTSQLAFQLDGSNSTYTVLADPTAQINVDGSAQLVISGAGTGNTLALTGGASILLTNGALITGDPAANNTLSSDFFIHGSGAISNLSVVNSGTIQAEFGGLTITPTSGGFTNNGTLQTVGGTLILDGSQGGVFTNNAGITTLGGNIRLYALPNNSSAPSLINSATGNISINSGDTLRVYAPALLNPGDTSPAIVQNDGAIQLTGGTLEFKGDLNSFALNGSGTLSMSDDPFNQIDGFYSSETFTNGAGHTIQGAGTIWALQLVNNGNINANAAINPLVISANPTDFNTAGFGFLNNGTINVTGSAAPSMIVDTTFGQFQNNASGTVFVKNGSTLLFGSAGLGGVIQNDGGITNNGTLAFDSYSGTFALNGSGTLTSTGTITGQAGSETLINGAGHTIQASGSLDIATVNNGILQVQGGALNVSRDLVNGPSGIISDSELAGNDLHIVAGGSLRNDGVMNFSGGNLILDNTAATTVTNSGSINLDSGSRLILNGGLSNPAFTLDGTGSLHLGDSPAGGISVAQGPATLNIGAGQTVDGGGTIGISEDGFGSLTVHNEGSIVANGATQSLTITNLDNYNAATQTLSGGSYTSIQPLIIQNLGTIQTIAAGTSVTLNGVNSIIGPGLGVDALLGLAENDGTFVLSGGRNLTLQGGGNFANSGLLQVDAGSMLDASARQFTSLDTAGNLTGSYRIGGTFRYTPQTGSDGFIRTILPGSSVTLDGGGSLITSDGSTDALTQLSANQGSLTLTGGRSLTLSGIGTYCNCGTLTLGAGSTLDARAGTFQNLVGATLVDGTYNLAGTFAFTPSGSGDITTIGSGASVTLSGNGRIVYGAGGGTDALAHLSDNEGTFGVTGGKNMVLDAAVSTFTNNGTLVVGAGSSFDTNNARFQNVDAAGNLTGNYNVAGTFRYVLQTGASGIVSIDAAASLTLAGAGQVLYDPGTGATNALTSLAANNGSLTLTQGANLAVSGGFTNNGTMLVNQGASFSTPGQLINSAGVTVDGPGSTLTAAGYSGGAVSTLTVANGSTADLRGGSFDNVDASGSLTQGNFVIGGTVKYDGLPMNTIGAGASLTISGSGAMLVGAGDNALAFLQENDGAFALRGGAALTIQGGFFNGNPFGASSANLTLSGPGTNLTVDFFGNAANVNLDSGATMLSNSGVLNLGNITLDGKNTKLAGPGLFMNAGSSLTLLNGATADFRTAYIPNFGAATDTFFNLFDGFLTNGSYTIGGNFLFDPSSDPSGGNIQALDFDTSLTLIGKGKLLYGPGDGIDALQHMAENDGSLSVIQNANLHTTEDFFNEGDLLVGTGGLFATDGFFSNDGSVNIDSLSTVFTSGVYYQEDGYTQVDGGLVGTVDVTGGTLKGTGTLISDVTVESGGTVKPGDSPGILTISGNYTQYAGGNLDIEFTGRDIAGVDWSLLSLTGTADLEGLINVHLLNSITFQVGDIFDILLASSVINDGVQFNLPNLGPGEMFVPIFTPTSVQLEVAETPEPGTWLMLSAGLLAVAFYRRRSTPRP